MTGMTVGGRPPACVRCGGSGYVYLWSTARAGTRRWFCDRSTCKRFWSDAGWIAEGVGDAGVVVHALQPLVSTTDQRVLQPL